MSRQRQMTASEDSADDQPRRRAATACERCRRKKLKCDTRKPQCQNCNIHGKECIQVVPVPKPRPTNRRIQHLEEENRRLRELAAKLQSPTSFTELVQENETAASAGSPLLSSTIHNRRHPPNLIGQVFHSSGSSHQNGTTDAYNTARQACLPISAEAPENSESQYHGPTSAFFDEPSRFPSRDSNVKDSSENERWSRNLLVSQTARQRHLEAINLASGNLNFDGVDPQLGMHLLSIFWCRHLHCGLVVYRPAFMRDMGCSGPYFSRLLLNAIYFSASKHSPRTEIRKEMHDKATAGWSYRQRITQLLRDEHDKSSITTIQALLITASSLFSRCDERSASWLYAGNAFNMVIDLGLHVTPLAPPASRKLSEEDLEVRRRVFWGAFVLDKIQCLYQGRPPILRISDADISITFFDDYEELEPFNSTSFTDSWGHTIPLRNTTTLHKLCSLSQIMEGILTSLYAGNYATKNVDNFYLDSMALQVKLEAWRKDLPSYFDLATYQNISPPPLPHYLSLLSLYNVLVILLRRPLIAGNRLHSASPSLAYESFVACLSAANEIVHILHVYKRSFSLSSAPYIISYATYISATILVRVIAQKGNESNAYGSLMTCLSALEQHMHLYAAARRAKSSIHSLMKRMGVTTSAVDDASPRSQAFEAGSSIEANTAVSGLLNISGNLDRANAPLLQDFNSGIEMRVPSLDIDAVIQSFTNHDAGVVWNFHEDFNPFDMPPNGDFAC